MTFSISHPETKTIEIPFVKKKKNESELPLKKLTFCNTGTKKNEDFTYYDYVGHLEKFGYEWSKYGFNYEIKIQNSEIIKKLTLKKKKNNKRRDIQVDESRIWNMLPNWNTNNNISKSIISYSVGYLFDEKLIKDKFNLTARGSYDFTSLKPLQKNIFIGSATENVSENQMFEVQMICIRFIIDILLCW